MGYVQSFYDDRKYILVLEKGDLLLEKLREFTSAHTFKSAWFQGFGGALELEMGYYDLDARVYRWKQYAGVYEITNLQGNIARDNTGEALFHVHGTFSDRECRVIGGHVRKLVVGGTCELLVQPFDRNLTREIDEATGLNLLCAPEFS